MLTGWMQRFEAFVSRKTRTAVDARLTSLHTEADAGGPPLRAIGTAWSSRLFDGPFYLSPAPAGVPAAGLVFVQSRDGNTVADDPAALGGGETDTHLIYEGLSRVAADAVLAGAATVRGGDIIFSVWHPEMVALRASFGLPRHPVQIVATLRGLDFDRTLLLNVPSVPVVILTTAIVASQIGRHVAERPWIRVVTLSSPTDLAAPLRRLRDSGIRRMSVIGGRTIAGALIEAGLVQDLYLTTAPRDGGQPDTPLYPHPLARELVVRKRGTGTDTGVMFEHWMLTP